MAKVIGIDLGTSNSACAVMEHGRPAIVPSAEGTSVGGKAFPSSVAFTKDGQLLVGEPARRQAATNPEGTVQAAKRKMGTDHVYRIFGKEYSPQQIAPSTRQKVKRAAEASLGEPVKEAVITVPAYFNDNQRQATKDAGAIAGIEVLRIINEPTAACLAYGLDKAGKEQKILVFDLGGGTLDVTIMDMAQGVFEVKSTSGDTQLGGTDMDNALIDCIAGEFKKETGVDVRSDKMAIQRIREAAEKAKIELSHVLETGINLPFITADTSGPKHLTMKFTRATLEQLIDPIINRCRAPVENALRDAKLQPSQIDRIILVGGPTRMPVVQRFVEETVAKKVERGVDQMECVAMGAAIQVGIIKGDVKDVLLLDVTPLSMGIETMGGVFTKLIERNTTVPTRKSQIFSTAADSQPAVTVRVMQGERQMAADNTELGRFDLIGIPPAPRGVPQIEVAFDIDANGIVHVSAKDLGTGKEQSIKITAQEKLSKEDIEKMVKQAEQFAQADTQRKELAEAKNQADQLVYSTEKSLRDLGDKVSQADRLAIEQATRDLKDALKSDDAARIKRGLEALTQASHKLAEEVYKKSQATSDKQPFDAAQGRHAPREETAEKGKDDKVVDAEFKVKDDK